MKIAGVDLIGTVERTARRVMGDDVAGLAAELAYRFFLALFPFFIFVAALGGFAADVLGVVDPTERIMGMLGRVLPPDAAGVVRRQVERIVTSRNTGLLSLGIAGAIWAASSGVRATMKAMNRAYEVAETRSLREKYLVSVGLTLLAGSVVVGAFVVVVVGQVAGREIAEALGLEGPYSTAVAFARWPVTVAALMAASAVVYWAAPNIDLPFKWITPGAALFTFAWLVTTAVFGFYVSRFASYDATYGTLGGVVVLLLWFYITAFVLLAGAELNAVVDDQVDHAAMAQRRREVNAAAGDRDAAAAERRPTRPAAVSTSAPAAAARPAPVAGSGAWPPVLLGIFAAGLFLGRLAGRRGRGRS